MAIFSGRRIYDNNVFGTVADDPLIGAATTLNAAGLANLSAVASNHAVIVIDPLRSAGAPEIVIVTAHTASATSATISRGAYGTVARQHAAGTLWIHAATKDDLIQVLTANPSDNHEGQLWYRSDTDIFMAHNGSAAVEALPIGAWQSWTPTTANLTLGNGTITAKYTRIGRTIHFRFKFALGSTSAMGSAPTFTLPAAPNSEVSDNTPLGTAIMWDHGTGTFGGIVAVTSGSTVQPLRVGGSGSANSVLSSTAPMTWTTNDQLICTGAYEAAS